MERPTFTRRTLFPLALLIAITAGITAPQGVVGSASLLPGDSETTHGRESGLWMTPTAYPPETAGETSQDLTLPFQITSPAPETPSDWRPPLYPVPWAPGPHDHFYLTRPIGVDEVNWPVEDYRYGGSLEGSEVIHTGVDIDASPGTPVLAAGSGQVIWAGYGFFNGDPSQKDPYGLAVVIRHPFGYQNQRLYTVYAHMSRVLVSLDQQVAVGDVLGEVGATGNVTGPHLHFEVRVGDNSYFTTRNPELWVSPPQGWGILAARVMGTGGQRLDNQVILLRSLQTGQNYWVKTYGPSVVNADPYYDENLVLSDLPEGDYLVRTNYLSRWESTEVHIAGGQVSYLAFYGRSGFSHEPPPGALPSFATPSP